MRTALLLLVAFIPTGLLADPVTLTGTVLDGVGGPVADAQVYAIYFDFDVDVWEASLAGSARTDAEGRFAIEGVEYDLEADAHRLNVAAVPEGLAVAWLTVGAAVEGLQVVCGPPVPIEGRVIGEDGAGIAARVTVMEVRPPQGEYPRTRALRLPDDLVADFSTRCDAEGRFSLDWCGAGVRVRVKIAAEGYGEIRETITAEEPAEVTLLPAATLRGRLVCEQQPDAVVAGITVAVSGYDRELQIMWGDKVETDEQGRFEVANLHPGPVAVAPRWPADAQWQAPSLSVETQPGETTEVELELQRTWLVSGRVVDAETGQPIEGVGIHVSETPAGRGESIPPTDAEGRYRLRVLPGKTTVHPGGAEGYVSPDFGRSRIEVVVEDADAALPDITLEPGVQVTGRVVDEEGEPVADAEVVHTASDLTFHSPARTDGSGEFTVGWVAPDQAFTARARKGDLMTAAPVPVDAAGEEPLELVIREGAGVRLAVRVVDGDGNPIEGAEVNAYWRAEDWGMYPTLGETGADGRLVSEVQWPEGSYQMVATAPGCSKVETDWWEAVSGETHDFGEVALIRAGGVVAGRVVDANDQPVAGATVRNSGDGPQAVQAQTDDQGRFRLEGLYPGHACIIAEKDDLFGGARVAVGAEDGVVTVTPEPADVTLGEPREVTPVTDHETNHQVALALIEEALQRPGYELGDYRSSFVGELAEIDADRAFAISAQEGGAHDSIIFRELGQSLLLDSPDEALAYLLSIEDPRSRLYRVLFAVERLASVDPERARQELLALIPQASEMPEPKYEAQFLGSCGEALYALDPEAAIPVIRRAESIAQTLQLSDWDAYARGTIAEALCRFDLEAALALIADLTGDTEPTRHQPNIAARIAADRPDEAVELMAVLEDWGYGRKMPRVVYHMAPAHPDRAIELAGTVTSARDRARCLGYIALALREGDPARSLEVFQDAARTLAAITPEPYGGWENAQLPATMAELAHIGARIGYPDIDRLVWRAIALRPAPSQEPWGGNDQGEAEYLKALAFVDPRLAAELVRDAVARQPLAEAERYSDRMRNLLQAAAAADAHLAAELARALPADDLDEDHPWFLGEYVGVVRNLLRTPEDRYVEMMSRHGNWVPGAPHAD